MKKLPPVKKDRAYYLRVFRAEHDLSQTEAAEYFGVGTSMWSLMEDGKRSPSPKIAAKLAKVTGVQIEVFLGIEVTR